MRRSRVRGRDTIRFDIHDRVNWAVERSDLELDKERKTLTLLIQLDTTVCPVMDYFEIFLGADAFVPQGGGIFRAFLPAGSERTDAAVNPQTNKAPSRCGKGLFV